jgi:hypothetical protein
VKSLRIWKCEFESGFSPRLPRLSTVTVSRVAELEQENARLQTLAQKSTPHHDGSSRDLISEVEQLRARLAAAEQRERELNSQLSKCPMPVKTELSEPRLPTSPVRHQAFPSQLKPSDKTSASLSLLVSFASLRTTYMSTNILPRSCSARFPPYFQSQQPPGPQYPYLARSLCQIQRRMSTQPWPPRWTSARSCHAIAIGGPPVPWTLTWSIARPASLLENSSSSTLMPWASGALTSPLMLNLQPTARSVSAYTTPLLCHLPLPPRVRVPFLPHLPRSALMTYIVGALLHLRRHPPPLQSLCSPPLSSMLILSLASAYPIKNSDSTSILRCYSTAPPYSPR